ncbi:MAG: RIP metalloprotease RseP [Thermodesulfobacteriota bacterium]
MLTSAIAIILVLGLLIFFHELGHFSAARALGIGVRTFALGFGPRLTGFRLGRTEYQVSSIPLGGYVQLVGESPEAELPEGFSTRDSFAQRPPWQRMIVVAAGPIFNFVLAILIYWVIFASYGQQAMLPVIGEIQDNTPAAEAGLQAGDRILSINAQQVQYWNEVAKQIQDSGTTSLDMQVQRDQKQLSVTVTPTMQSRENIFGESTQVPIVGIIAAGKTTRIDMGPLDSFTAANQQTWRLVKLTGEGLVKLVERVIPLETVGGPILIAQMVHQQTEQGLVQLLGLTALISINLGLLNLLPIPILDGGHLLFFLLETVSGRPLDPKWQQRVNKFGLTLLLALMGLAIYNDLQRLFTN